MSDTDKLKSQEVKIQDAMGYHMKVKCEVCLGSGNRNIASYFPSYSSEERDRLPALTCYRCNGKGWYVY
jgi:hypothetical protein